MALTSSQALALGTPAPDFNLPNVDGTSFSLDSFKNADILVIVFTCNHCPYAIALEDRFIDIQHDYAEKGVRIVFINPNDDVGYPEDSFENMIRRAAEKNFPFPYLRDASQKVALAYKAACTPDVFVFDRERRLAYNGRVDDNWKEPEKVTRKDLRMVIDALLERREIPFDVVPAFGCSIKWKLDSR
jgi:peroxiredoxin